MTGSYADVIPWESLTGAAEKYATLGLSIFPLGNTGTASGLTPRSARWKTEASKELETISQWWRHYPNAGIGLPLGKVSQIIALEVDYQHGGLQKLTQLGQGNGLDSMSIESQSGVTYLFHCADASFYRSKTLARGVGLTGSGGFVPLPPSRGATVRGALWLKPLALPLPQLPPWLKRLYLGEQTGVNHKAKARNSREARRSALFKQALRDIALGREDFALRKSLQRYLDENDIGQETDKALERLISEAKTVYRPKSCPLFEHRRVVQLEPSEDANMRHVLHAICFYMGQHGGPAWPTELQLAQKTGLTRETVCNKIKKAKKLGLIRVEKHRGEDQRFFNNVYHLPDFVYRKFSH